MTAQERLIARARSYVGYLEKKTNAQLDDKTANAGSNNWTRFGRDYDALMGTKYNGQPWCAMYGSLMFAEAFGPETAKQMVGGNLYASCTTWVNVLKSKGQWIERTMIAKPGDIIFYSDAAGNPCHVGLVTAVSGQISTVEGNTSSASGVIANGGGVAEKSYPHNYARILGYGRPKYELVKETDKEEKMSKEDVFKLIDEYFAEKSKRDESAWSDKEGHWDKATAAGIVDGTAPQSPITREQVVAVLGRIGAI